jgi:polyisoprenoid-binding protein YceI
MSTESVNQQIPAGTWTVDPAQSVITFAVIHNSTGVFRSGFGNYSATLAGADQPQLAGTVEARSIEIDDAELKGHLMGPDFFDAARFPQLRFNSTEFSIDSDGAVRIEGDLEMRGECLRVEATGKLGQAGDGGRVVLSLGTEVDRRAFGMGFQMQLPKGGDALEYEVSINAELEFVLLESQ